MKRIIILIIAIVLVTVAVVVTHKPKKVTPPIVRGPVPAQITHGVQKPYNDCVPNQNSTPADQAQLANTEKQMAAYNDTPNNTSNPGLQRLNNLYKEQIAEFDTCTLVTD